MVDYTLALEKLPWAQPLLQEQLNPTTGSLTTLKIVGLNCVLPGFAPKAFTKYGHTKCQIQQIVLGNKMKIIRFSTKRATHLLLEEQGGIKNKKTWLINPKILLTNNFVSPHTQNLAAAF